MYVTRVALLQTLFVRCSLTTAQLGRGRRIGGGGMRRGTLATLKQLASMRSIRVRGFKIRRGVISKDEEEETKLSGYEGRGSVIIIWTDDSIIELRWLKDQTKTMLERYHLSIQIFAREVWSVTPLWEVWSVTPLREVWSVTPLRVPDYVFLAAVPKAAESRVRCELEAPET